MKVMLNYPKLVSVFVLFIFIIAYNFSHPMQFVFDSKLYWEFGRHFISTGEFSFLSYDQAYRGYILPLLSYVSLTLSDYIGVTDITFFKITSSLFFSFFLGCMFPLFYEKLAGKKLGLVSILLFSLIVIYFWRGYFLYPLSDFISLFCIIVVMYNLLSYFSHKNYIHLGSAGFFLGVSILSRPSYQIALVPIFLLIIIHALYKQGYKKSLPLALISLVIGMSIPFGPQMYINANNYHIFSPFPQTQVTFGNSLFTKQLFTGLHIQRYETNINTDKYPLNSVFFYDSTGFDILKKEGFIQDESKRYLIENLSLKKYIGLVLKYPMDIATIYAKHIFNSIDITYSMPYLTNVYSNRIVFSLINYTMIFISLLFLINFIREKKYKDYRIETCIVLIVLLPSFLSIPAALETRFFISFYFLFYAICVYHLLVKLDKIMLNKALKRMPAYLCFIIICFMLSSIAFSNIQLGHYFLNNH